MIVLLLLLTLASIALFIIKARNSSAYWMAFVLLGWSLSMSGFVLFISKYGGFYYRVNTILFFNDAIRIALLTSPISLDAISRMITAGRSLFVFSLIGFSLNLYHKHLGKGLWKIQAINFLFSLTQLLFYDPIIYRRALEVLNERQTYIVSLLTRTWFVISVILALSLLLWEYKFLAIPWIKRQRKFILMGLLALVVFYSYLGFMGPLQVTDVRTYYFLYSDFYNFNPPITLPEWYIGIGFTGFASVVSFYAVWKYAEVERQLGQADMQLERKLKTANIGVRVFTHAIKNQLLSIQLILNQTSKLLTPEDEAESKDALVAQNLAKTLEIVNHTLSRLDTLYSSFKTTQLHLKAIVLSELMNNIVQRLEVPNNIQFEQQTLSSSILADQLHLSEALYNILCNAFEAIGTEEQGQVHVTTCSDFNWLIIQIQDNGPGIPRDKLDSIFDPFYTSKNTNRNWGVGLSYAKQVIDGHFGHIHVESHTDGPNKGTSFYVYLPIYNLTLNSKGE
ncbi:sensor histidine kinase [Desulfosporosinus sp. FKB]|uniref:sensor histidine kinase n=1 Tax=Desulfosporosinus sp. FKB TaxID=1969835 RepID=UPI000B49ED8D|nr:sensor histidine kinase [Desulfosporosinus sp. FKB]